MKKIYFITSNPGKQIEAEKRLSKVNIDVIQKNIGYPEVQADTLEEVVEYGAKNVREKINDTFILEDAGLFIKHLNGFPGVYSSYVFHTIGCKGILELLGDKHVKDRKAVFRSVIAYKKPENPSMIFIGECHGKISNRELGKHGFGYDPIFIPDGETRTFAQMDLKEKNCFSHRGKSLEKLMDYFKKQ